MKQGVLFVCIHNSARNQMAEAFLNFLCGDAVEAHSAGLEPGRLNPLVVQVMSEAGFDMSANRTKAVADFIDAGRRFDYVVTVCDETSAERCPVFPGGTKRLHWSFPDPSAFQGRLEERLEKPGGCATRSGRRSKSGAPRSVRLRPHDQAWIRVRPDLVGDQNVLSVAFKRVFVLAPVSPQKGIATVVSNMHQGVSLLAFNSRGTRAWLSGSRFFRSRDKKTLLAEERLALFPDQ